MKLIETYLLQSVSNAKMYVMLCFRGKYFHIIVDY